QQYTDLAPVSNEHDNLKLEQLSGSINRCIWIGLKRNSSDREKWLWSGGRAATMFFWAPGKPNNCHSVEDSGCVWINRWNDANPQNINTFFCHRAIVVEEELTWEEALDYCREHHDDLASVASETEMLELPKHNTTEHIWIGLRFLSRDWLWMDRQVMDYEAWGEGENPGEVFWATHDCEKRPSFISKVIN
uniref:C-type lectin domain-containing protein n=1 Tax=Astatotilapia calliptera TaxID=8154 RepID=A0A3P8P7R9_ASTCA